MTENPTTARAGEARADAADERGTPAAAERLAEVARQHLGIAPPEEGRVSPPGFHAVTAGCVAAALRAAYELGLEQGRRPAEALLLDALEQVQDQLRDVLRAEAAGSPYTRREVLAWLGELRELARGAIAAANGDGR